MSHRRPKDNERRREHMQNLREDRRTLDELTIISREQPSTTVSCSGPLTREHLEKLLDASFKRSGQNSRFLLPMPREVGKSTELAQNRGEPVLSEKRHGKATDRSEP